MFHTVKTEGGERLSNYMQVIVKIIKQKSLDQDSKENGNQWGGMGFEILTDWNSDIRKRKMC